MKMPKGLKIILGFNWIRLIVGIAFIVVSVVEFEHVLLSAFRRGILESAFQTSVGQIPPEALAEFAGRLSFPLVLALIMLVLLHSKKYKSAIALNCICIATSLSNIGVLFILLLVQLIVLLVSKNIKVYMKPEVADELVQS